MALQDGGNLEILNPTAEEPADEELEKLQREIDELEKEFPI